MLTEERLHCLRMRRDLTATDYEMVILHYENELKKTAEEILKLKKEKLQLKKNLESAVSEIKVKSFS